MSEALPTPTDCCCCCRETIIVQGGGGGQIYHGDGPPTGLQTDAHGVVQDPALAAIYYDDAFPNVWYAWDVANQTWPTPPEAP